MTSSYRSKLHVCVERHAPTDRDQLVEIVALQVDLLTDQMLADRVAEVMGIIEQRRITDQ